MGSKNYLNEPLRPFRIRRNEHREKETISDWWKAMLMWTWWLESNDINKGKYTPGNIYNHMKETFIKNWRSLSVLGLDLSEDIPNFTNHDIS